MAAGDPTGDDLVSGTTNGDTLPEPWPPDEPEAREIDFGAGIELTEDVTYAIVVRASDAVDADDAGLWQMITDGGEYGGITHLYSTDGGSNWTSQTPAKVFFKTYDNDEEPGLRDSCSFAYTGAGAWLYGSAYWSAMTFTASSTYTIGSIKLELFRVAGATPGTITVSIRATEGAPEQATILLPTDGAEDVTLDQATITWADGGGATSYDIYYGDNAVTVAAADTTDETGIYLGNQAAESFTITDITLGSPFDYLITRYWRIDAVNAAGTTAGDTWSFISISFDQLRVSYVLIDGGSGAGPYDDPAGVEGTDWSWTGLNNMMSVRRLVVAANSKIYYESI